MNIRTVNAPIKRYATIALPAIIATIIAAQFAAMPGVPAFLHDWIWPADRSQALDFALQGLWAWDPSGVGSGLYYPFPWLPNLLEGVSVLILGARAGLVLVIAAYCLVAAAGMYVLSRRFGGSAGAAALASAVYLASPVTLNEVHAGHLFFLLSMAILPWAVAASLGRGVRSALLVGVLIGLGSAQQQFFFFDLTVVFVLRFSATPRFARWFTAVSFIALLVTMPQWIGMLSASGSYLKDFTPFAHWEWAQSADPVLAARMLGYIGGYSDRYLGSLSKIALWVIPVVGIAAVVATKTKTSYRAIFVAIIGWLFVCGLKGPIGAPLLWLFVHVYSFALFRELYDFAIFISFGTALAIGSVPDRIVTGRCRRVCFAVTLMIVALSISISANMARGIPLYRAVPKLAIDSDSYRYVPNPAVFPVTTGAAPGGFSPLVLPFSGHPSASIPDASYPTTYAGRSADSGDFSTLDRFGIGATYNSHLSCAFNSIIEPSLKGIAPDCRTTTKSFEELSRRIVVLPFSVNFGTVEIPYRNQARILIPVDTQKPAVFALPTVIDPRTGWARVALWPTLAPWVYAEPVGVFTMKSRQRLALSRGVLVVGDANGSVRGVGCRALRRLSSHWKELLCDADPTLQGSPPLVVSELLENKSTASPRPLSGAGGSANLSWTSPIFLRGHISGLKGSAVILRDKYDPGWLFSQDAPHVRIDGYANAWILRRDYSGNFWMIYYPGVWRLGAIIVSLGLSILAWAVAIPMFSKIARARAATALGDMS